MPPTECASMREEAKANWTGRDRVDNLMCFPTALRFTGKEKPGSTERLRGKHPSKIMLLGPSLRSDHALLGFQRSSFPAP